MQLPGADHKMPWKDALGPGNEISLLSYRQESGANILLAAVRATLVPNAFSHATHKRIHQHEACLQSTPHQGTSQLRLHKAGKVTGATTEKYKIPTLHLQRFIQAWAGILAS